MNKSVLIAILGLAAFAQAATEIIMTPKNFLKLSTPKSLLQSFLKPTLQGQGVVWGECPD